MPWWSSSPATSTLRRPWSTSSYRLLCSTAPRNNRGGSLEWGRSPRARAAAGVDSEPTGRAVYRRLLADPVSGTLSDISEQRYRPSATLERAVRARDVTCRFPGCRRSALGTGSGTDLDHTVPWPVGSTSAANLAVLCRRHHRLKHTPGWSVVLHPDGSMTWTTPTGRLFSSEPWSYLDPADVGTEDKQTDEESGPDPPQRE